LQETKIHTLFRQMRIGIQLMIKCYHYLYKAIFFKILEVVKHVCYCWQWICLSFQNFYATKSHIKTFFEWQYKLYSSKKHVRVCKFGWKGIWCLLLSPWVYINILPPLAPTFSPKDIETNDQGFRV
jgi:hypothetical protein